MAAIAAAREPLIHIHGRGLNEADMRDLLTDPISFEQLEDPVIDPCGHTFSRVSIETWLAHNGICPLSRLPLRITNLRINRVVSDLLAVLNRPGREGLELPALIAALDEHEIAPVEAGLAVIQNRRAEDQARPEPIPARLAAADPNRSLAVQAIALARSSIRALKESTSQTFRWWSA